MNVYDILLAKKFAGGGVTPTGNINITDTAVTDVAAYATAQVVDGNLIAGNIKKDVDILGVTGSYEGSGGGGGAQPQRDVNFIDYDGTILHSYTAAEFAALTAMPNNPDHSSDIQWGGHTIPLTSQGWNWSLADAKAYVAAYGKLWVGQMFKPTDGKLHLCVRMGEGRLNPTSQFAFTGTATIDWGDGTEPVAAVSGSGNGHTYAAAGDYDIAIGVSEGGTLDISGNSSYGCNLIHKSSANSTYEMSVYQNCIIAAFVPDTVTSIGNYAFSGCYGLQNVVIPDSVTSIGKHPFNKCYGLHRVVIPDSVISIGQDAFGSCYGLQNVVIQYGVTSIKLETFSNCLSLESITIPDSVTKIEGGNAFNSCYSLQSVTIPDSVTSIGASTFYSCCSLHRVVIPESVTSIAGNAFFGCFGLGFIRFESATPPTVSNSNAWLGVPEDCIIYVPAASLDTYKAATNYPSPSDYTYVGY